MHCLCPWVILLWQEIQNVRDHHRLHVRPQVLQEAQEEVHLDLEVPGSPGICDTASLKQTSKS